MSTSSGWAAALDERLRDADGGALEALLRGRPDLLAPAPADLDRLVARAATVPSLQRALDRLDEWRLAVLHALLPPVPSLPVTTHPADAATGWPVTALLGLLASPADPDAVTEGDVTAALDELAAIGLALPDQDGALTPPALVEVGHAHPAGLGRPLATLLAALPDDRLVALALDAGARPDLTDPTAPDALAWALLAGLPEALDPAAAPPGTLALLEALTVSPVGSVQRADRPVRRSDASAQPVPWLLARGLLVPTGPATVELPFEVGVEVRRRSGLAPVGPGRALPPPVAVVTTRPAADVDRAAGGAAFAAARGVHDLLQAWSDEPPPVLRSGGLGVRELRRLAERLDRDEADAALLVEVAAAAGLVARSSDADPVWLPTTAGDLWLGRSAERQAAELVVAYLRTTRVPSLVGERDERERRLNALEPDLDAATAPEVRRTVLEVLADLPAGAVPDPTAVAEAAGWRRPLRDGTGRRALVGATLREAAVLGLTGLGGIATPGRTAVTALGAGSNDGADLVLAVADALVPLLPEPLDHVLLQADLTAVAPGPLEVDVARELALLADVESTGGATVYRFSPDSVRRAFDAGRGGAEIQVWLGEHSRTPVPQPLAYLVDDVGRRHGRLRVGAAQSVVRCEDPALLDQVMAGRGGDGLRLVRLAPTVVSSPAPPDEVLAALRAMGLAPAAEAADGTLLVHRPEPRRAPTRPSPPRYVADPDPPGEATLAATVRALRAAQRGQDRRRERGGRLPTHDLPTVLGVLREALLAGGSVRVGLVDTDGTVTERVLDPVALEAGMLTALDHREGRVRTVAAHRLTGAELLAPGGGQLEGGGQASA